MHRIAPSQVLRSIARTAFVLLLTAHFRLQAQQKTAPPPPPSKPQLEDRVKTLETRADAAEKKAASAAMEKDYITRVQKQYETYYEKVLTTQTWTLAIFGFILTALFALAAKFSIDIFDSRTKTALDAGLARVEKNLSEQNAAQLKDLESALTKRIIGLEADLKTQSDFQFHYVRALAGYVAKQYAESRRLLRQALAIYKSGKPKQLIEKRYGGQAALNIFLAYWDEDDANFVENAKKELADKFYDDLEEELALAAVKFTELAPLIAERK